MGKMITLGSGKQLAKDIELCRTTNEQTSEQAVQLLLKNQIPFTKSFVSIPFFLRVKFHGADQFYIISTNRNCYSQARRAIDQMDYPLKKRLIVSNF